MQGWKGSLLLVAALVAPGCGKDDPYARSRQAKSPREVVFKDDVESRGTAPENLDEIEFVDTRGQKVRLVDYRGERHVVLVFTRGFSGYLCPLCETQTSRLIANYDQFVARDAEVLLVFPGQTDHLDEFIEAARTTNKGQVEEVPFPILLDESLKAVDFFGIRKSLALPSTYLIDKEGRMRFVYVGANPADRPSVKALLDQLDLVGE